jgi:hypothetical protein
MTNDKFEDVVVRQLAHCHDLLVIKGKEYSLEEDRLIAFKRAAALQGETVKQALCGMLAKHVVSVYDMCMSDYEFAEERWDEKITDTINYLPILKAAIKEEQNG